MWFIALALVAVLVLAGYYLLSGSSRGLTAKTAVVVVRGDDLTYDVVSAIKPGDLVIDRYNKPYFEVVSATYMPFAYRGVDAQGRVVYSNDPQRYTVYVTCKTINPFYDDVPVMAKQRIVLGRSITMEGPTWAYFGRVVSLQVTPVK
ncbi:DUF4330 family protein [Coprothermobacteraceae bacterium]|nr:DUF4330 family protein [Coprothermobacteraceae bacterium]